MAMVTENLEDTIEKMAAALLVGILDPNSDEYPAHLSHLSYWISRNINKIIQWAQMNPRQKPPIQYIPKERKAVWLTREQRRRLQRAQAKLQRKRA